MPPISAPLASNVLSNGSGNVEMKKPGVATTGAFSMPAVPASVSSFLPTASGEIAFAAAQQGEQ